MKEQDFYNVAVATIKANKDGVIAIIRKNGIAINSGANEQTISNAVLSLLKTSPAFKKDFGDLIMETNKEYASADGDEKDPLATATTPKKKGAYWAEVFNPEFTRNALDNIMNIASVKLGAGNTTPYQGMNNAQLNLNDPSNTTDGGRGLSVGAILGISLGVVAIVAGVIYFVKKK